MKKLLCACAVFFGLVTPALADTVTLQELGRSVHTTSGGKLISIFSGNTADGVVVGVVQADNTVVTTLAYSADGSTILATQLSVANLVCDLSRPWSTEGGSFLCLGL